MPLRRLACAAAATALLGLQVGAVSLPAFATGGGRLLLDVAGDGEGFVHHSSTPLLSFHRLAPGYAASGAVEVKNDSPHRAALVLRAYDVEDDENGCLVQETRMGDTTCGVGDGDGELGEWLELTVSRDGAGSAPEQLWTGSIADLESGAELTENMPAGAVWPLRMTVELPRAAGNDTMTDKVGYDLRWTASAENTTQTADVKGVEASAAGPTSGGQPGIGLPFTGSTLSLGTLLLDLSVLLAGVALLYVSRWRRDRAPQVAVATARHRAH